MKQVGVDGDSDDVDHDNDNEGDESNAVSTIVNATVPYNADTSKGGTCLETIFRP